MTRKKVLLLFGGESTEHAVSRMSARNVAQALDEEKFEVTYAFIDEQGLWWLVGSVDAQEGAERLVPVLGSGTFETQTGSVIGPDVILPILHGRNGEDGAVQALAQLLHIPIVGCHMASSAAAMNKVFTKQIVQSAGIPVVPYTIHRSTDEYPDYEKLTATLGDTLFVKPANAGSSVGVNKATSEEELKVALDVAFLHDEIALIEMAIDARELEVAVLGNHPNVEASVVGEIQPEGDFYSYDSKYSTGTQSTAVIPALVSEEVSEKLQRYAVEVFELLQGNGLARVDFFVDRSNEDMVYLNEVNTIPGFTDISMYPKLWEAAGMSYSQLIERLIELALEDKMKTREMK